MAKIEELDNVVAIAVPNLVETLKPIPQHKIDPLIWEMFGEFF